uniref:Nuclear receptor interacting protein 2 n=1 Tax=Bos taurus TaxID=9913 RepID=F1MMT7_BOVIN
MSIRPEAPREEGDAGDRGREAELRGRARLSQQRRLRQATQFLHKDSADLLPLDGLKRLGTSKDWQPHSVIQRRLVVEGSPGRPQGEPPRAQAPIHGQESTTKTSKPERPALLVNCKCRDQDLQVAVDTGTQYNQISAGCLSRLGLGKRVLKAPGGDLHPGPPALVEQLELQLGQETVECSAQVVGKSSLHQSPVSVSAILALPPGWGKGRASQLWPTQTSHSTPKMLPLSPRFSGPGWGGKRRAMADGGQQCPQMVPADVESPELCLGLQTLLSLQVRRCSRWYHTLA